MKSHRLLLVAITAPLLTAVPSQSSAADVSVDISSFAPLDPNAVVAQIELNVLLKQYEKLLTQVEEISLQHELGIETVSADATEDQKKQAKERSEKRQGGFEHKDKCLKIKADACRVRIMEIIETANVRAAKEKSEREAKKTTGQNQPNVGTLTLRGKPGDVNGGTLTFTGDTNIVSAPVKGAANAPQPGRMHLNGPLTLKGPNEYTNPTNLSANVQPTPAK